jgi:hypothetical protein
MIFSFRKLLVETLSGQSYADLKEVVESSRRCFHENVRLFHSLVRAVLVYFSSPYY